ncbi:hypothetical protein AB4Z52_31995 [Rhizobium sp. 2YAF20]|uniref:hypothetical protein n=1 Tax=Rhizobium sp. 2YAF20 TaxID=3233027 RepID=UPI003F9BE828
MLKAADRQCAVESYFLRDRIALRALVARIISSPSGAAMNGLSGAFFHADPEVVLEALTEWCIRRHVEPDDYLISLVITLYKDGNDTPERLLKALETEFEGDDVPLSRLGTSQRFDS